MSGIQIPESALKVKRKTRHCVIVSCMTTIHFTQEELDICDKFANEVDTSLYARRNQFDDNKRKLDSKVGKLGEFAVYRALLDKYPDMLPPDVQIYSAKQKSWDYDLKATGINLHVKAQEYTQSSRFGESWIFQAEDSHVFKNYKENDYVAFVTVNLLQKKATVKSILKIDYLHKNALFDLPKLEKLQNNKFAVYMEKLEKVASPLCQI